MRRREFTAGLLSSVAIGRAWSQERRIPRIALFHPAIPITSLTEAGGGTAWRAFFSELRRLGYVEGQSVSIQRYSAEGHHERYADIAREIVRSKPDLIVTGTNPVVLAFKAITSNVPVVAFMIDPLKAGLVESLARPGGNLTGITLDAGIEIWGKRLELLKEAVPSLERTAFLGMREGWEGSFGKSMRDIAGNLGTSLISVLPTSGTASEIERVFAEMAQQPPDAALITGEGDLYANRLLIAQLAQKYRIPTMCPYRDYVDAGGLMAYTVDLSELLRHMAGQVQQIISGTKPGNIPIYQPTKFALIINLKTAKALGLSLSSSLLSQADEIIE
jgi:putative ABC transport system substrate-binding protein